MNHIPNSSLGICTSWPLTRVGNPIAITDWYSVVPGIVGFHSPQAQSGHCEGLVPGKLMLVEGAGTQNVNGFTSFPPEPSCIGWPLRVIQTVAGTLVATLAGPVLDPGPSVAATATEVTPGITDLVSGGGPDGWLKSLTLQAWRQFLVDADLATAVVPGCKYSIKLRKNNSAFEYFYSELDADACEPFKGKTVAFGGYAKPASGTCRPYIFDGAWHFGPYHPNGGFTWQELSVTVNPAATYLARGWEIGGTNGDVSWVTQPRFDYGTVLGDYQPSTGLHIFSTHANMNRNYYNGYVDTSRIVRIEQEMLGKVPQGLKAIHMNIETANANAGHWMLFANHPDKSLSNFTIYAKAANIRETVAGMAAIGRYLEPYSGLKSDAFYIEVPSPWFGTNIDMIACET